MLLIFFFESEQANHSEITDQWNDLVNVTLLKVLV